MNRFRMNLHLKTLFPGSNGNGELWRYEENEIQNEKNEVIDNVTQESAVLAENIIDNIGFENSADQFLNTAWKFAAEESEKSKYDLEQLNKKRKRFWERCRSKNSQWEEYAKVRDKNITTGFWLLISTLRENWYFDNKYEEIEIIKYEYIKEIRKQYRDKVWNASEEDFNKIKDALFTRDSKDYPANKVYCKLTKAATIFATDRTTVEWYGSSTVSTVDAPASSVENLVDKNNRNFLTKDLPQYLWDIKTKRTQNIPSWLQTTINLLPGFNIKQERSSKVDRDRLNDFLKLAEKITVNRNEDKAVALLKVFKQNRLKGNETKDNIGKILRDNGITVDEKYWDDIARAGNFYIQTQRLDNSLREQHPIYLSILKIIEDAWGVNQAVNKYKSIVEQSKKDEKQEKKEGYKDGKKLRETNHELRDMATMLWITDFTYATRLSEKPDSYFQNTPVERIIANISNDATIDARDNMVWWSKTWSQFLEVFGQVWKEKALSNLAERLNLESKVLGISMPTYDAETMEADIKNWHTWTILFLQKIISNPGEDLLKLLSKDGSKDPFEVVDENTIKEAKQKAKEMIDNMDLNGLIEKWIDLPTPESMQSGLATALYTEYNRWVWLWGRIPFDNWIKWVAMNTWVQVRDDGTVVIWLGFDYRNSVNLWKWWSLNPTLSAWAFLPIWTWKPEISGSVGLNMELAKKWITDNGIDRKFGITGGVTQMLPGVTVLSGWFVYEQDKIGWLDKAEQQKKLEFRNNIIKKALDKFYEERSWIRSQDATKLNFSDPAVVSNIKKQLNNIADEYGIKENKTNVVNETARLLVAYNNADVSNPTVRDMIADEVSDQYARAWKELRKSEASEHSYVSKIGLGAFWAVWTHLVWIYANVSKTDHDLDAYGDTRWNRQQLEGENTEAWNETMIANFNQRLWLSDKEKLRLEWDFVTIPSTTTNRVRINENMKWLMKKDQNRNILIRKETPMSAIVSVWAATQSKEIVVGWGTWKGFAHLDTLKDGRFTTWDIDLNKVNALRDKVENISVDNLNKALDDLKTKFPNDKMLQNFRFDTNPEEAEDLVKQLKQALTEWKGLKINLEVMGKEWTKTHMIIYNTKQIEGKNLTIEYTANLPEMLNANVREIAKQVYDKALALKDPSTLYTVKHEIYWKKGKLLNQQWSEYTNFVTNMNNENYGEAKENIKEIFQKLDKKYGERNVQCNFSEISQKLDQLQGNDLWQALMSIRNVFARTRDVLGRNENDKKYHFNKPLWQIIERRARWIKETINTKLQDDDNGLAKQAYTALIDASEKYRETSGKFNVREAEAHQLGNTVWFNLWDKKNPENPLFNPDIYNPMVDLDELEKTKKFTKDQRDALHERAMTLFATKTALIAPILTTLWLPEHAKVTPKEYNDWKLTLDIWEWNDIKTITLSSKLNFGYFTQCVNHTILLSYISATTDNGTVAEFKSGVREGNRYREWNETSITATTTLSFGVAVTLWDGKGEEKPKYEDGSNPSNWSSTTIPGHNGDPIWGSGNGNWSWGDNLLTQWGKLWWGNPDHNNDGDL